MTDFTPPSPAKRPVVLCILDGWGDREETENNAIALADTPNWDRYVAELPRAWLNASAEEVGLPAGQMGNSEVGHMNLGAGRVVLQELPKIDAAVADGSLAQRPAVQVLIETLRETGGACHLMGLLSPGGVHSHQDHIIALASAVTDAGVPVVLHAFLDGRDTPPSSAKGYMETVLRSVSHLPGFSVGTVSGRYYAMDRDKRWDRVLKAWRAIHGGQGEGGTFDSALAAIQASYEAEKTDEFMLPVCIGDYAGMADGDALLMANFRADRAREITAAFGDPDFDGFDRPDRKRLSMLLGMTEYSSAHTAYMKAIFPPEAPQNILGAVVAEAGMTQLRIAETEKYAHVTFFLNGGREDEFPGEERILVRSPDVATYDLKPEMSAPEVTDKLVAAIRSERFDLIVVNYANGDMVGHTGILDAAIQAAQAVDMSLGRLEAAISEVGGAMLVTADHGNCEQMIDPTTHERHTAHTLNRVPLLLMGAPEWVRGLRPGRLADVAPTLLRLLALPQPVEMTGQSLLEEDDLQTAAAE